VELSFLTDKLALLCNSSAVAQKQHGANCARLLRRRLADLAAVECLELMRALGGDCEELKANRAGQLSLKLAGGKRLIFTPDHDPWPSKPDGGLDWKLVTRLMIIEVEDYHRG
jgi:proteic killer suppression protein